MRKFIFSFFLFYFFCHISYGQEATSKDSLIQLGRYYRGKINKLMPADSMIYFAMKSKEYFKITEQWGAYIGCMTWLAEGYYIKRKYTKAIEVCKESLLIIEQTEGKKSAQYARVLSNMAVQYDLYGELDIAIDLYLASISLKEKLDQNNKQTLSNSYLNLGYSYKNLGDNAEALRCLKKSLSLRPLQSPIKDPSRSVFYSSLALAYKENNHPDSAIHYASKCLDFIKAFDPVPHYLVQNQLYAYQILAEYYLKQNNIGEAKYFIEKTLLLQGDEPYLNEYETFEILSQISNQQLDFAGSVSHLEKAIQAAEEEFTDYERHPVKARYTAKLADVYGQLGNYGEALKHYQKALWLNATTTSGGTAKTDYQVADFINVPVALEVGLAKAKTLHGAYLSEKKPAYLKEAFDTYVLVDQLTGYIRQEYRSDISKYNLSKNSQLIYEQAISAALLLFEKTKDRQYLEKAFLFSESNKANQLLESINESLEMGLSDIPDSLLKKEKKLRGTLNYYRELLAREKQLGNGDRIEELQNKLFDLKQEHQQTKRFMEANFMQARPIDFGLNDVSVKEVRNKLMDNRSAILEYFFGKENIYIFCLTKNNLDVFSTKVDENWPERIEAFRSVVGQEPKSNYFQDDYQKYYGLGNWFYEKLLKQPLAVLPKGTGRLKIIPDDVLAYLPFELLLKEIPNNKTADYSIENLGYLLEDYQISYGASANLLIKSLEFKRAPIASFLGIAPYFGDKELMSTRTCFQGELSGLRCNIEEVEKISLLMSGESLFNVDANIAAFEKEAAKYQVIHLATHACTDENNSLNQIFFSDDHLTDFDLNNLHLNADLVVLSACNTSIGKLYKGEGLMSLARSFTMAGSSSLVSTLWPVDDCSTSDIMVLFYHYLSKGEQKDMALQKAKLSFLKTADPSQSHPFYWGGAIQLGNSSPIQKIRPGFNFKNILLGIFMAVLLSAFGFFLLAKFRE